jgi:hypothetical protein
MAVGAIVARILTQYSDKGSKAAQKDINKLGKMFDNFAKNVSKAFIVAAAASAAFAAKIAKDSIKLAIEQQSQQNRLRQLLRTTGGASEFQIEMLGKQAEMLERLGVVSAGNITVVQSQLATFDLQAKTIAQLTPAILDYVTAEKGASASTDQFKSATNGLAQALQGNFASLTKTGFIIPDNIKKIIKYGTESQRAQAILETLNSTYKDYNKELLKTPEGKLQALQNSFDSLRTKLGTALLPVLMKFVEILRNEIIPQIDAFIQANQGRLVASLQVASNAVMRLLKISIKFGEWVANNTSLVKNLALIIAGMWAVGRISAFITALKIVIGTMAALRTTAAGAAIAMAYATGGASVGLATAALAIVGTSLYAYAGHKKRKNQEAIDATSARDKAMADRAKSMAPKTPNVNRFFAGLPGVTGLTAENKSLDIAKKKLTVEQKIINAKLKQFGLSLMTSEIEAQATAFAIGKNLSRQGRITSPTVSLATQGDGSAAKGGISKGSNAPQVNVNITAPYGTKEDFIVDVSNNLKTKKRRSVGGGALMGMLVD